MDAVSNLRALGNRVTPMKLWRLCRVVLEDERFLESPASAAHHPGPHQERGGLVLHTLEVATAAVGMAGMDKQLAGRAYTAAVFHDYGKIHEYAFMGGQVTKLPFARRIGHVVFGWCYFTSLAPTYGVDGDELEDIGHALLAHMGRKEWGSPVEPQTRLAHILHTADLLSAKGLVTCD